MIKQVKNLMFDADDTLWENNIYYVHAAEDLVRLLLGSGEAQTKIENDFQMLEREIVKTRGYGSQNFLYILKTLFTRYDLHINNPAKVERLEQICNAFIKHLQIQPGIFSQVNETLSLLRESYNLYVLTKGNIDEQWGKLKRSNLLPYFREAFVKPEKDIETYKQILNKNQWNPSEVCMVGNSPKSDINPALKAGLWAIYIPYEHTWVLDDEPLISDHPKLITVQSFSDIVPIFI